MKILLTSFYDSKFFLKVIRGERFRAGEYCPQLALYQLAGVLREEGHDVSVLDPAVQELSFPEIPQDLEKTEGRFYTEESISRINALVEGTRYVTLLNRVGGFDMVGFSANSFNWVAVLQQIRQVKEAFPDMPVVLGGVHPTFALNHLLAREPVDFVVRGEGEKTLLELVRAVEGKIPLVSVRGISYRKNGIRHNEDRPLMDENALSALPLPAIDLIPKGKYLWLPLETSRGCLHTCRFCSILYHNKWRGISPDAFQKRLIQINEHVDHLATDELMPGLVYVVDDTFSTHPVRCTSVLRRMKEIGIRELSLRVEARIADLIDSPILDLLAELPTQIVQASVDAGSDEGLRRIRKKIRMRDVMTLARKAEKTETAGKLNIPFIIGYPWDGYDECMRTVQLAYELTVRYGLSCNLNWFLLMPGSDIWEHRADYALDFQEDFFDGFGIRSYETLRRVSRGLKEPERLRIIKALEFYQSVILTTGIGGGIKDSELY